MNEKEFKKALEEMAGVEIPQVDFVHLHNHSHFSLYDGMQRMEVMALRAKQLGFKGIALTDHGKVGGFPSFKKACDAAGIKPIYGCEFYIVDDIKDKKSKIYHQTILAKNVEGYENINQLSSLSHKQIIKKFVNEFPCLTLEDLEEHKEGLIVTSGCTSSKMSQLIINDQIEEAYELAKRSKSIWGEDYYLEVMWTGYEPQLKVLKALVEMGEKLNIKVIATNDVHYTYREEADLQRVKISISRNAPLPPDYNQDGSYYMKSYDEMARIFKGKGEQYLKNTMEIYEKVDNITPKQARLPHFHIPKDNKEFNEYKKTLWGRSEEEAYLRFQAWNGLKRLGLDKDPAHVERLAEELETIRFTKFDTYFLMVWDYCDAARIRDIKIGAGRGSGVGSLALYCLGVIGLDPMDYDLTMDRFLYAKADYRAKPDAFFEEITEEDRSKFDLEHQDREEYVLNV